MLEILCLAGDGIGPEITRATLAVLESANRRFALDLRFKHDTIGFDALAAEGTTMPARILDAARRAAGILLGPVSHLSYPPPAEGGINPSAEMRVKLDLYANIRPARSRLGVGLTGKPVDLVIVRECTEGFYADRNMYAGTGEFMPTEDMAMSVRKVTAKGCERIARRAFELARRRRQQVTAIHKSNVLRLSDGLFLREVRRVAAEFQDVRLDELIVDAAAALLLRDPARFDVMVTTNMFGDILSDEASELSGSLGLAGSILAGDELCVAQAQHGSAPDIAGRDVANPTSLILSAAMMLDWMGRRHANEQLTAAAASIDRGVDAMLADPERRTADLGGSLGTQKFGTQLAERIAR